jgi:hypothetical protein
VAAFCSGIMLMSQAHYGTQNNNWLKDYLYLGILGWLSDTSFFPSPPQQTTLAQHVSILINHFEVPYLHIKHFTLKSTLN